MKNYILLYALCIAYPQLQAMESLYSLLPNIAYIEPPSMKPIFALGGGAVCALLAGLATDFAFNQDRQLLLIDYVKVNMRWNVRLTLLLGADPYRKVFLQDGLATTAIHEAVKLHAVELLTLFLARNGDIDTQDSENQTPLHVAAMSNDAQVRNLIRKLVARGASLQATDAVGNSPLHFAAQREAKTSAEELLKLKANVNAQDFYGNTPLHDAAIGGNLAIISLLLGHGARTDILTDSQLTVWDIALQNNHNDATDMLLTAEEQRHYNAQLALNVSPYGKSITEKILHREIRY